MRRLLVLAAVVASLGFPAAAWAARPLALGFFDTGFTGPGAARWFQRSAAAGASWVRIDIGWDAPDTPKRPPGFDARNPADPAYNFTSADAAIRLASGFGLKVLVTFTGAPRWAEGPHRPGAAPHGTWRPDARALGDYGVALGLRYSGHFPDPANPGHTLPRVSAFQVWNEPNLSDYLTPQWSGGRPAAPSIYRGMLNAFYAGVKSVDPKALVVTAGTAPFGDPQPGGERLQPALFWRGVLCLFATRSGALRRSACPDPAHFDVLAHHPYAWGSPQTPALWPDDVAIPDLGKLTRLLRAAEHFRTALGDRLHPLWVTEVGYNTDPPNPGGLPLAEDSRWVAQTLEVLWSEGVSVITWNQVGDQPPEPADASASDSGVYYHNGSPKPALTAYRFPLVAWRSGPSRVEVWGRSPAGGRLEIQRRAGVRWHIVRSFSVRAHSTFEVNIGVSGRFTFRGQVGSMTSLSWSGR